MSKPIEFFTAEDFKCYESAVSTKHTWIYDDEAARRANQKLLSSAKVVYSGGSKSNWDSTKTIYDDHQALLICEQSIKPECKHKNLSYKYWIDGEFSGTATCVDCKFELEPIWQVKEK